MDNRESQEQDSGMAVVYALILFAVLFGGLATAHLIKNTIVGIVVGVGILVFCIWRIRKLSK